MDDEQLPPMAPEPDTPHAAGAVSSAVLSDAEPTSGTDREIGPEIDPVSGPELDPRANMRWLGEDDLTLEDHDRGAEDDPAVARTERSRAARARNLFSGLFVLLCCSYAFWKVHPELVLRNTTPTGGDMGSHVWGPAYLRDYLLPHGQLTGWTPDWYNGFPIYLFYMVLPSLFIVLLSVGFVPWWAAVPFAMVMTGVGWLIWRLRFSRVIRQIMLAVLAVATVGMIHVPYNISFKLIAVAGIVTLPAAAWWLGRGLGLRFGGPELLSIAALLFLMDKTMFHIYGGNIASTMAGEFAFSISLSFGIAFLGSLAKALRTGGRRAPAVLLGAGCALSHAIPFLYVMGAALVIFLVYFSWRGFRWIVPVGAVSGALAAWWYLPFYGLSAYLNDMGWEKAGMIKTANSFGVALVNKDAMLRCVFPIATAGENGQSCAGEYANILHGRFILAFAFLGVVLALVTRTRAGIALGAIGFGSVVAFRYMGQGRFWNARVLPLLYLMYFLMAAVCLYLLAVAAYRLLRLVFRRHGWGSLAVWIVLVGVIARFGHERVWTLIANSSNGLRLLLIVGVLVGAALVAVGAAKLRVPLLWVGAAVALCAAVAVGFLGRRMPVPAGSNAPFVPISDRLASTAALVVFAVVVLGCAFLWHTPLPVQLHQQVARPGAPAAGYATGIGIAVVAGLVTAVALGMTFRELPGGKMNGNSYQWAGLETSYVGVAPDWAKYNFKGLEDKGQTLVADPSANDTSFSEEYFGLIDTLRAVGKQNGCGRVMWEYEDARQSSFGTPMSFMMFPYFTQGCMGSQEGLYFEASSTTPFHFLMQSELSQKCSCAQRFDIFGFANSPYKPMSTDFALGVRHMQLMGIRYYLSTTKASRDLADASPDLHAVGRFEPNPLADNTPREPYVIYEVADAPVVRGLSAKPEVWPNVSDEILHYAGPTTQWFMDPERWDVYPATTGPADWPRNNAVTAPPHMPLLTEKQIAEARKNHLSQADIDEIQATKLRTPELKPLPAAGTPERITPAKVSNVKVDREEISFDVDRTGAPVLVNVSYFPSWKAEGATGPYRAGANQMVVVPTATHVVLRFGMMPVQYAGYGISALGLVGLIGLVWWDERERRRLLAGVGRSRVSVAGGRVSPFADDDDHPEPPVDSALPLGGPVPPPPPAAPADPGGSGGISGDATNGTGRRAVWNRPESPTDGNAAPEDRAP
jgi:hypothetical protein